MFRLINSHLQAYSLQVKSQDAVHTLGSQYVYISEIFKQYQMIWLYRLRSHRMMCTHWDRIVFTSVKYLSHIILPRKVKRAKCVTKWLKIHLKFF